jgi:DNA-binding MarR family transcriptional regulator
MGKLISELKQTKPFRSREDEVFVNILRTASALMRKETEFLKKYELTPTQYNVLRILRGAGADGLSCRENGDRMITYDPDITKLLDRLEARHLVMRERQQNDRRVIIARISEEGIKLLKKIDKPGEEFAKTLLGHLGARQLDNLNELLESAREKAD